MMEWNPFLIALVVIAVVALLVWLNSFCEAGDKRRRESESLKFKEAGFDEDDVRVFLSKIGSSVEEFFKSEGIRNQYKLFNRGVVTDFMRSAEAKKKADAAQATANNANTMAAASMIIATSSSARR